MSFSNSGGTTLALPSPTHAHHMGVTSAAVRSFRRSMSRSPSKLLRADSLSSDGSHKASPQSPCRRLASTPQRQYCSPQSQLHTVASAPLLEQSTTPDHSPPRPHHRSNLKLSLRSVKSTRSLTPSRPLARARASPKSPYRRNLANASDSTSNLPATALFVARASSGQENESRQSRSPSVDRSAKKQSRHSCHLDVSGASDNAQFLRSLNGAPETFDAPPSGTLKRSDATMNLDQPAQGSPKAKRRSLHGAASFGQNLDFGAFGRIPSSPSNKDFEILEDGSLDYELSSPNTRLNIEPLAFPIGGSHLPKRTSSLRRSTLQQRYGDKGSLSRRTGERQLAQMSTDNASPARQRPRVSTDQFLPPAAPRESLFASLNSNEMPAPALDQRSHQPHPLSKTLTASSSNNSVNEEGSTDRSRPPVFDEKPRPPLFARSLPLDAQRPVGRSIFEHNNAISTPGPSNQLWPGAFRSTGLISKVNRNFEEEANAKLAPPDTPCKRPSNNYATYPFAPSSALKKQKSNIGNNRNSFAGLPSTPLNLWGHQDTPGTFGELGVADESIFRRSTAARGSVLNLRSHLEKPKGFTVEPLDAVESDTPPTPTRNSLTTSMSNLSECSLESPSARRSLPPPPAPMSAVRPGRTRQPSCKLTKEDLDPSDYAVDTRQTIAATAGSEGREKSSHNSLPSFGRSRASRGYAMPMPLNTEPAHPYPLIPLKSPFAKIAYLDSASPIQRRSTPQTPQEEMLPLDTGRLSIHQADEGRVDRFMPPPVTPTAGRDLRSSTSGFVTPVNVRVGGIDIDPTLLHGFDKVEVIGKGEFSTVYRVTEQPSSHRLGATPAHGYSPTKPQIFAVKKSKRPFLGQKDRDRQLREVRILQALRDAEHVVHYVNHWEHNLHLFIQTEFCEEGNLDRFLNGMGKAARLDDFRIFKILQDLCLGLKEIHDAGFMHLDMKPANILITFEGILKIGDFGLAQSVAAAQAIDEGDREYMAPELLGGRKVSKSADVFSLGLITLEAAANVVLPENGPMWVALRSGDLSEVPSLTWNPSSNVERNSDGVPTGEDDSDGFHGDFTHDAGNLFGSAKRSELQLPPEFMVNAAHCSSLDQIVRWMTAEEAYNRPTVDQILELEGMRWIGEHRAAPATVYEGNWGPAESIPVAIVEDDDTEMTGV